MGSAYLNTTNGGGVLADLADEYPIALKPIPPRAVELLQDDDNHAQYNTSSILTRVAEAHPDAVKPATEQLLAVPDDFSDGSGGGVKVVSLE